MNNIRKDRDLIKLPAILLAVLMMCVMMSWNMDTIYGESAPGKTVSGLGVSSLKNPYTGNGGWCKVYYGNARSPLRFKVLNTHETVFGGNTLLMDCDSIISRDYAALWWDYHWQQSQLQGATYFDTKQRLTNGEIAAVHASTKTELAPGDIHPVYDPQGILDYEFELVKSDKFFLLDAAEAMNVRYGFPNNRNATDLRKKSGNGDDYWLRSKSGHWSQPDSVPYLKGNGGLTKKFAGNYGDRRKPEVEAGISPAMNINLNQILFTTLVSGVNGYPGSEYKLTILDNTPFPQYEGDLGIDTKVGTVKRHGNEIEVPFTVSGKRAQNVNRVSYLITDKAWNAEGAKIIKYDSVDLTSGSVANGTASFTLPAEYDRDNPNHHVYLFAEDVNELKQTDYASNPVKLNIPPATIRVEATPYEGVYDGKVHTIGMSYEPNYATIKYGTVEGTYDLDAPPTYTDAGEYTIYYQVTAEDYEDVTGSTTVKITPRPLTVNGTQIKDKVYDGTTVSEVESEPEVTNKVEGDDVDVAVTGVFHDANAGENKPVTLQYAITGEKAANYVISPNSEQEVTASISKRTVTVDGIKGVDKVDDDYLNVDLNFDEVVISNMIEGDDLGVTAQGNMGPGFQTLVPETVFIHDLALTGEDKDNYLLDTENSQRYTTVTIWPNGYLFVDVSEKTHVYDGQPHTIKVTPSDTVENPDPSKISIKYSTSEDGPWQTEPITLTDAGDTTIYYQVVDGNIYDSTINSVEGSATLKVTPKSVSINEMAEFTKVYDGTTNAPAGYDFSTATIGGKVDGDDVYVESGSAVYTNPNAGNKLVLLSGMTLGGAKAGNYTLEPSAQIMGTITPRPLTVSGATASDKVYDGTNSAKVQSSDMKVRNVIDGDDVAITSVKGSFESPNVNVDGEGRVVPRTVNISYELGGEDADNYFIDEDKSQMDTKAVIFRKDLAIGGGNTYWDYDGKEHGGATGYVDDDVEVEILYGETDDTCNSPKSPTFKNAGMHLVHFLVISKNDNYNGGSGLVFVNIAPKRLVVSGITANDKDYDKNRKATLNTDKMKILGILDGDNVTVIPSGTFADANAGKNKKVAISYELGGDSRSNYYIDEEESQTETTADINRRVTITYKLNGGKYNGSSDDILEKYDYGTKIKIHAKPTRSGYRFLYWKGSEYQPGDTYTANDDHTFVAQWEKEESTGDNDYPVTPDPNGDDSGRDNDSPQGDDDTSGGDDSGDDGDSSRGDDSGDDSSGGDGDSSRGDDSGDDSSGGDGDSPRGDGSGDDSSAGGEVIGTGDDTGLFVAAYIILASLLTLMSMVIIRRRNNR